MRLIVDVYRGSSYYPDLTVRGISARWVDHRIRALHDAGFECKVREIEGTLTNSGSTKRGAGSLRASRFPHIIER